VTILNAQGKPLNHSHSAAETLSLCARTWWYSYVLRLETPSSPAAEFGVTCHDILERLCKAGEAWADVADEAKSETPNHWRVLEAVFPLLPWVRLEDYAPWPMPPHWHSETRVDVDAHGLPFKGFIDLWTYHRIPAIDPDRDVLVISDLKVSGNPMKWGKDPDQLAVFGQPLKYAYAIAQQEGIDVDRVYAEHLYTKRTGRARAFVVNARTGDDLGIPWESVETHWRERVAQDSKTMLEMHSIEEAESVPASARGCRAFGGCPFNEICPGSPDNFDPFPNSHRATTTRSTKPVANNALSALSALAGPKMTAKGASNALERVKQASPTPQTTAAEALLAASTAAQTESAPLSPTAARLVSAGGIVTFDTAKAAAKSGATGRSRFFLKHYDELGAELVAHGYTKSGEGREATYSNGPESATEVHVTADAQARARAQVQSPSAPPPPSPESTVRAPAPAPEPSPAPEEAETLPTLYIGCKPSWSAPQHIDSLLAPVYTRVEDDLGITFWDSHQYNEGRKMVSSILAVEMRSRVESGLSLLDRDLFIPRDHPLASVYVSLLRRHGYNRIVG
jgi:hypothetical protein